MPNAMPWPWGEGHPDEGPDGDVAVTVWHVGDGTRSTRPETTGCPNGTTPLPSSAARVAGTRPSPPPGAPPLVARVPCSANPGGLGTWLGSGCVSREGRGGWLPRRQPDRRRPRERDDACCPPDLGRLRGAGRPALEQALGSG